MLKYGLNDAKLELGNQIDDGKQTTRYNNWGYLEVTCGVIGKPQWPLLDNGIKIKRNKWPKRE